jgi:DNA-binding NarL/FixJ family response regulator
MTGPREEAATPTTLFVIDDHPVVREGLRMLLEQSGEVRVVGAAGTARAALRELPERSPDVVLLDLDLGGEDGLDALPRIRATAPRTRVLILTALRERARDEDALRAGACGLVLKDAPADVLLEAIRTVASGGLWFDPRVLSSAAAGRDRTDGPGAIPTPMPATPALSALTPRERDIVALIGEGLRNEETARRLGITEKTVRNHLTVIFDKVGVSGRLELLVWAYEHGLVPHRR